MSNTDASPISLKFVGGDEWGRAVFKGSNGRWYKTVELLPTPLHPLAADEKALLLGSLHSTDKFEGEPCSPVDMSRFTVSEGI